MRNLATRPLAFFSNPLHCGTLLLFAVAALCLYLAARMLVADISAYQTNVFLRDWSIRKQLPSEPAWDVAQSAANRAVAFFPVRNGAYLDTLGRVHEWRHFPLAIGIAEARPSREAARDAYRQAVASRPLWPSSWSRLAMAKMKLREFDDEFDQALRNSLTLGPWRVAINYQAARLGLTAWHELGAEQRVLVLDAIGRLAEQAPQMAKLSVVYSRKVGLADTVCAAMTAEFAADTKACQPSKE